MAGLSAKPVSDIMAPYKTWHLKAAIAAAGLLGYCYNPYKPEQMHWFCKRRRQCIPITCISFLDRARSARASCLSRSPA